MFITSTNSTELESLILNAGFEFIENLCSQFDTTKRILPHDLLKDGWISLGKAKNTRDKDECLCWSSGILTTKSGLPCLNLTFKCWQGGGQVYKWSSFELTKSFLEERGHSTKDLSEELPTPSLTTPKTGQDASNPVTPVKSPSKSEELSFEQKKAIATRIYSELGTTGTSPYFQKKGFSDEDLQLLTGIRFCENFIAIPLFASFSDYENCTPCGLQKILDDGSKKFSKNSHIVGSFFVIGNLENTSKIAICEGVATGLSIHLATKIPTIVAFNAGNLKPVAEKVKAQFIESEIIICADNDQWKAQEVNPTTGKLKGNTGLRKGRAAADVCNGKLVFPVFDGLDCSSKSTDFNDIHILSGIDGVRIQILSPIVPAKWSLHNIQQQEHKTIFISIGYENARAVQSSLDTSINGVFTYVKKFSNLKWAIQEIREVAENPIVVLGNNNSNEKIWMEKIFRKVRLENVYSVFPQDEQDCKDFKDLSDKLTKQILSMGIDKQDAIQTVREEIAKQILEVISCIEGKTLSFEGKFLPPLELDPSIEKCTFILKTHMGSGKTKQIIDFLNARNAKRVIVVSPRTSLIDSDIRRYRENGIELSDYRLYKGGAVEKLIVCTNSLDKFKHAFKDLKDLSGCILVLDEVEQIFSQLATMTNKNNDLKDSYKFLEKLICHCQIVIASDAFCSKLSINQIKKLRKNIPTTKIESTYKSLVGQTSFQIYQLASTHHFAMSKCLTEGKRIAFISNSCRNVDEFAILAKKHGRTVLKLTSETRGDNKQKQFFEDPNKHIKKYDCIAFSPVVTSGISIDTEKFDCCFASFSTQVGSTPEDALQMLGRIRTPPDELHIYVDDKHKDFSKPDTFEGVLSEKKVLLNEERIRTNKIINIRDAIDSFCDLQVEVEAKNNWLNNNFLGYFIDTLEGLGAWIQTIRDDLNVDDEDAVKEERRFCKEERRRIRVQEIKNAQDLSHMEAERIKQEYAPPPSKICAVEKYDIREFYKVQEVNEELIIEDNEGKFRKQIRTAEKIAFLELAMKEDVDNLDGIAKDKRGVRRAMAWMMRREYCLDMLKFAGYSIKDGQFIHDGRELTNYQLSGLGFTDYVIKDKAEIELIHKIPLAKKVKKADEETNTIALVTKAFKKRKGIPTDEETNENPNTKEARQKRFLNSYGMGFLQTFLRDMGLSLKYLRKEGIYVCNQDKVSRLNDIIAKRRGVSKEDRIDLFLNESCIVKEGVKSKATPLYTKYVQWCNDNGVNAVSQQIFGRRLSAKGFKRKNSNSTNWWIGIMIKDEVNSIPSIPIQEISLGTDCARAA